MSLSHLITAFLGLVLVQSSDAMRPSQALLDKLTAAETPQLAQRVEQDVWDAWMEEGGATVDLLMQRAVDAQMRGEEELARDLYDRIILIDPDYAEVWNRRGALFYTQGRYDEAIADLEEALKREPRHFAAWAGLGVIFEALEEYHAALTAYRRSLEIHPHNALALMAEERLAPRVDGRTL